MVRNFQDPIVPVAIRSSPSRSRTLAGNPSNSALRSQDFISHNVVGLFGQIEMTPRVISDLVTMLCDLCSAVRMLLRKFSSDEERAVYVRGERLPIKSSKHSASAPPSKVSAISDLPRGPRMTSPMVRLFPDSRAEFSYRAQREWHKRMTSPISTNDESDRNTAETATPTGFPRQAMQFIARRRISFHRCRCASAR